MTKLYSSSRGGEGGLRDTSTSGSSPPQASSQIFLGAGEDCSLWPQCHRTPTSPTTGRPCLQEGRVTLALVHFFFFYTLTLARGGGARRGVPPLPCKRSARDNAPTQDNVPPSCVTSNHDRDQ